MSARERVAMALQAAEADCLERGEVMGYSVLADAAIAAHLEALASSGHVVVKLPEPVLSPRHQEQIWEVGDSHVIYNEKWRNIRAELDYDNGDDDPLSASDARAFGAALLAAVHAAEAPE
ncbi:hypothetical protein [Mycobacterium sp. 48b]|uniref:hypothetical protein n=1 Tax=Mycobacterium sp. 48b TaxID=3400426 RepID=UPI003AAFCA27